jgi:hypothetical protein
MLDKTVPTNQETVAAVVVVVGAGLAAMAELLQAVTQEDLQVHLV